MKFSYQISGWSKGAHARNRKVDIILNPETGDVWAFQAIGHECPMPVWHGLQRVLLTVDPETSADALQAWLEEHEAEIEAIVGCYQGSEWDGRNHVGSWDADVEAKLDALDYAYAQEPAATYWAASEYLEPVWRDVGFVEQLLAYASLERAVEAELEVADQHDVLLDEDDLREAIVALLGDALERILDRHAELRTSAERREAADRAKRIRAWLREAEAA